VADSTFAEAVVREAWLDALTRLDTFGDRPSLSVWLFGVAIGRASPLSTVSDDSDDELVPAVDPDRFRSADDQYHGGWRTFPLTWGEWPDQGRRSPEVRALVRVAFNSLSAAQQRVVILRDVHGCTPADVSDLLEIAEETQRALLHRGEQDCVSYWHPF